MTQPKELIKHYQRLIKIETNDFRNANLYKLVLQSLKKGSVLDIGCGTGRMAVDAYLAGFKEVVATDVEEQLLRFAKHTSKKRGAKIKTKRLSIESLKKLGKSKFDNIICLDVLEHLENDKKASENIHYILKKGGRVVINIPAFDFLYGKRDKAMGHLRRYSKGEIINLLENSGFTIKDVQYWNFLGLIVYFIFEKILGARVDERLRYKPQTFLEKSLQKLIFNWVKVVENNVRFPIGLSLLIIAEK